MTPPTCSLVASDPTCRHCGTGRPFRRGLCWGCYADTTVRERYPNPNRFGPGRPVGPFRPCQACRHCQAAKCTRPRGLCWRCFNEPGVREKYAPTSKCGRRGVGHGGTARSMPEPTAALAGTPAKTAELARRAEQKLELWHPKDASGIPSAI